MKKLTLMKLNKTELEKREMTYLRGGCTHRCGCACLGDKGDGATIVDNQAANYRERLHSYGTNEMCPHPVDYIMDEIVIYGTKP